MFAPKNHPLLDIWAMLWHVTKAFPAVRDGAGAELYGRRPDTFAALMDLNDIESDTLNKDGRYADDTEHLFFSRQWSGRETRRQQTGTLKFRYPLLAAQPFDVDFSIKAPFNEIRISLVVMDRHPDKLAPGGFATSHRTFEQMEADMTSIFENAAREWLGRWALYDVGGELIWSPTKPTSAVTKWKMRDAMLTDNLKATFYRDVGSDRVAGLQGFITLKMPRIDCYLPAGQGAPVEFDYTSGPAVPRRPDGLPGAPNEAETPTT